MSNLVLWFINVLHVCHVDTRYAVVPASEPGPPSFVILNLIQDLAVSCYPVGLNDPNPSFTVIPASEPKSLIFVILNLIQNLLAFRFPLGLSDPHLK